ncbi:MAG TPA: hypothetical protein VGO62_08695, partial [Myxococcota bacterium]
MATFVALASGRPPTVDLPAHAILLRHLRDAAAGSSVYELVLAAPYTAFFAIARVLAVFVDDERAVDLAAAVATALLPVSSAVLAASTRRTPAVGVFALLGAFTSVLAWGMSSLVLGASALALTIAAARSFARRPTLLRAVLLAACIGFAYSAHLASWLVALPASLWVCATMCRKPSLRLFAPSFIAGALTVSAFLSWSAQAPMPFAQLRSQEPSHFGSAPWSRVLELPDHLAGFGRIHALLVPWCALVVVLIALLVANAARSPRSRARMHGWRVLLAHHAIACVLLGCALAYFATPLVVQPTYFVYPRFLVFAAVLLPACLPRTASTALLAPFALLPALALTAFVFVEVRAFADATACVDELALSMRDNEALVPLNWTT